MATVRVTAKLDNLKRLENKITKVNLSERGAKLYAETLQAVILQRSPGGSGNLASKIRHRKVGRYGAGVYAPYYFWAANDGRSAGRNPPDKLSRARFEAWAAKNGWDPDTLSGIIGKYGTKPKNYFQAARQIFRAKRPRLYKQILKSK